MRHKTKQCCREQSRGISCRGFHFQDSAKDIETSVPRSNIPMDLFGEKMYVSESRAFTGRCQPLKESLHSNRSESTTYQYPTGAALRQVHLQVRCIFMPNQIILIFFSCPCYYLHSVEGYVVKQNQALMNESKMPRQ